MRQGRILVVDDEPAMLRSMERILEGDHTVVSHTSPTEALETAARFKPDLAIVDIRMAGMDGFELMNELKKIDEAIQVILMTGSVFDLDQKLIRAIREKAFYYINKPFDREVLRALVNRCLEYKTAEEENRKYVSHLETQLSEVRAFQGSMLPASEATIEGFRIFAAHQPSVELAGDLYDYTRAGKGRVALLVADVVGHGASAAMLTGIVKAAFHSSHSDDYDPLAVVERVAAGMSTFDADRFVTLLCARVSIPDKAFEYVNAGHEGGLISTRGTPPKEIAATGPLVSGALRNVGWARETVPWSHDSLVLLYTDGIPEASEQDEFFGTARIHSIVESSKRAGPELLSAILDDVRKFSKGRPPDDDMTLLAIRCAQ
jgi:sigma-B regulation protein RsbU (phosphoserine phosphatase)